MMKNTNKIAKLIIVAVAAWVIVTILCGMNIQAQVMPEAKESGGSTTGVIKQVEAPASAYSSADKSSTVTLDLQSGDYIYVTDESDGWYQIYYRGDTLYVDSSVPMTDMDYSDEITAELTGMQITGDAWIDEYQMQVRAIKTARTWRIVIAILVVAFIAVTVVSTLKNKKNAKEVQA